MVVRVLVLALVVALLSQVNGHVHEDMELDMDLTVVKLRVMRELGWSSDQADQVIVEYKRFWILHKLNPGMYIVPSLDVDEVWHAHILHTHKYMQDSKRFFGHFFHHWPEDPQESSGDSTAYESTLKAYEDAFGAKPNDVWTSEDSQSADGTGSSESTTSASCGAACGGKDKKKAGCGAGCGGKDAKKAGCGAACGGKDKKGKCGAACGGKDKKGKCGAACGGQDKKAKCGAACGGKDKKGKCGAACGGQDKKGKCGAACGGKDKKGKCGAACGGQDKKAKCGAACGGKDKKASCGAACGGKDKKASCGAACGGKADNDTSTENTTDSENSQPQQESSRAGKCGSRCGASRCGTKPTNPPRFRAKNTVRMSGCSGMGGCSGGGMSSSFSWFMDTTILWNGWRTDTTGKYVGTIIALVAIMLVKEFLFHKRVEIARHGLASGSSSGNDQPLMASGGAGSYGTTESGVQPRGDSHNVTGGGLSRTWKLRLINAVLGAINLTLGYFVMLVVMTYNNGFFIAIILGGALAQFLFSVPWRAEEKSDGAVEVDCCEQ